MSRPAPTRGGPRRARRPIRSTKARCRLGRPARRRGRGRRRLRPRRAAGGRAGDGRAARDRRRVCACRRGAGSRDLRRHRGDVARPTRGRCRSTTPAPTSSPCSTWSSTWRPTSCTPRWARPAASCAPAAACSCTRCRTRRSTASTYRLQRWSRPGRSARLARSPATSTSCRMHVNEQTVAACAAPCAGRVRCARSLARAVGAHDLRARGARGPALPPAGRAPLHEAARRRRHLGAGAAMSAALADRVAARDWYHTLELAPGVVTPGWFDLRGHARHGRPARARWPGSGVSTSDVRRLLGLRDGAARGGRGRGRRRARPGRLGLAGRRAAGRDRRAARAPRGRHGLPDRARGAGLHGWSGSRAASTRLDPEVDGRFDLVDVGSLLLHLRDPVGALERVRAVCRGRVLVVDAIDLPLSLVLPRRPSATVDGLGGRGGGGPTGPGSCAWSRRRGSRSRRGRARCSCRPVPGSRRRRAGPRSPTCARAWGASCCSPATWARRTRPSTRASTGIRKFRRDPAGRIPHRTCGCLY